MFCLTGETVVVATTRPETMFGDTAIAVNPQDSRYTHLKDKFAINPLTQERIPIIFDSNVRTDFGTGIIKKFNNFPNLIMIYYKRLTEKLLQFKGAVKITPAHDVNDYETGLRHKLKFKQIFNDEGCLINVPDEFMVLGVFE
jgi:valyl-tRNA synthetase